MTLFVGRLKNVQTDLRANNLILLARGGGTYNRKASSIDRLVRRTLL